MKTLYFYPEKVNEMQSVIVELNGRVKELSLADLRSLSEKGLVNASTPICVEGEDCLYSDISAQVESGAVYITPPNKPQIISVEMDGKFKPVSLEQLKELNRLGFLNPRTRVNIDGQTYRLNQFASQLDSDTRRIKIPSKFDVSFWNTSKRNSGELPNIQNGESVTSGSKWNIVVTCMTKKYFAFSGRADRREFLVFALFFCLVRALLATYAWISLWLWNTGIADDWEPNFVSLSVLEFFALSAFVLFWLPQIPYIAVSVRRAYDAGLARWFIIPYILSILVFGLGFSIVGTGMIDIPGFSECIWEGWNGEGGIFSPLTKCLFCFSEFVILPIAEITSEFIEFVCVYFLSFLIPILHFIVLLCLRTKSFRR